MGLLGGIRIASVPPAAMEPVANASSYLYLLISGRETFVKVAALAKLEPVQAAKIAHAPIFVMAKPPGSLPRIL